jgi:hypothetical protein
MASVETPPLWANAAFDQQLRSYTVAGVVYSPGCIRGN